MKLTKQTKTAIVRAILADIKKPDHIMVVKEMQDALHAAMSKPVKRIPPSALRTHYCHHGDYQINCGVTLVCGDADAVAVLAPWREKRSQYDAMHVKLEAAFEGINTRKQFVETFPEFIKYAPEESGKCPTLPAVANVVSDLVKLGWEQTVFKD